MRTSDHDATPTEWARFDACARCALRADWGHTDVDYGMTIGGGASSDGMMIISAPPAAVTYGIVGGGFVAPAATPSTVVGGSALVGTGLQNHAVGGAWSPEPLQIFLPQVASYPSPIPALAAPPVTFGSVLPTISGAQALTPPQPTTSTQSAAESAPKPVAKPDEKPVTKAVRRPAAKPETVVVKAGDNLTRIAAAHNTTVDRLYELNKATIGSDRNLIRTGSTLKLP